MRKLFKLVTSRLFWSSILFIFEFSLMVYLVVWAAYSKGYYFYFYFLSAFVVLLVMSRNENPSYKMVWIALSSLFPTVGGVLYLLFGNKKIGRLAQKKVRSYKIDTETISLDEQEMAKALQNLKDGGDARLCSYIYNMSHMPACGGTGAKYFSSGEEFFKALIPDLNKAEKFIFIEYFVIGLGSCWNTILEILKEKASNGVEVRVIYDDMGSVNVLPINYYRLLESWGIHAICFNPMRLHVNPRLNFRDHRKILCIDGDVCYTGGLNLSDEYMNDEIRFGYWKDNAIRLEGTAVFNFTRMFVYIWDALTQKKDELEKMQPRPLPVGDGLIQPFGSNPLLDEPLGENAYLQLISNAKRYVWITTPYLIPDDAMKAALKLAAQSGIDIRIITPYHPDKKQVHEVTRSNYDELMRAGVKIYEFLPGFVHSKMFVSDDRIAIVGTTNLDYRSFFLHFELSVVFYGSSLIEDVKQDYLKIEDLSRLQIVGGASRINPIRKCFRYFYKLFSPAL